MTVTNPTVSTATCRRSIQTALNGSWDSRTVSSGYYDQYGTYYKDLHEMFEMHVTDPYTNNSIDLYFDDILVTGSSIIATSYNGNTISKYIFRRY